MIVEGVKLGVIVSSLLVVGSGWSGGVRDFDLREHESPLFGNDMFSNRNAVVGRHGKSIDVKQTLRRWSEGSVVVASASSQATDLAAWALLTHQTQPELSVDATGNAGGASCSVGSDDTQSCSVANETDDGEGWGTDCSTANAGGGEEPSGTSTCSVFVQNNEPGVNNTGCSAGGTGGTDPGTGNVGCSAGGTTGSVSCSTSGGVANDSEQDGDGTAVCSALGQSGNHCSAYGNSQTTCSTHQGQSQVCSVGITTEGQTTQCSTSSAPGVPSGSNSFCSASNNDGGNTHANICSAVSHGSPEENHSGTANCSTLDTGGGTCSVRADSNGDVQGQACTVYGQNGGAGPGSYSCSTQPGLIGPIQTDMCSVVLPDGTVTSGPTGNPPRCGAP